MLRGALTQEAVFLDPAPHPARRSTALARAEHVDGISVPEGFARWVREAPANLYDPVYLQGHPLAVEARHLVGDGAAPRVGVDPEGGRAPQLVGRTPGDLGQERTGAGAGVGGPHGEVSADPRAGRYHRGVGLMNVEDALREFPR
jgi:hypothetical protein